MPLSHLNYRQIELTECAINFDTPNRKEILKNGLRRASYENLLGRGTFGLVFKATYKGQQVAVKIINNQNNLSFISAVKNEMNVLNWEHKNIIRILYIEFQSTHSAIIMERFPGQCLQSILDQVELPLQHRFRIIKDIICGLNFCHSRGILHLDIKPQNVLIAFKKECNLNPYTCKICDFGSSQQFFLDSNISTYESLNRIPTGTIRYMSPEALKNQQLTTASDIFSLGITMWQLKSRKPPYFQIDCNDTVAYKVVKNNLRPSSPTEDIDNCFQFKNGHKNCLCQHFSSVEVQNVMKENSFQFEFSSENSFKIQSSSEFCKLQMNTISNENFTSNQFGRNFTRFPNKKLLCPNVNGQCLEVLKCKGNSLNKTDNFDLQNLFLMKKSSECGLKEQSYKNIYTKCWSTKPEQRPSGVQIENQIRKFLN